MTVKELREMLEMIDDEIIVKSSSGIEYASITLFHDTNGHICLDLE